MASPGKKPRDIKNLKARLGRTITPGQAGLPTPAPGAVPAVATPPIGSIPPGATPAPGALPTPAPGALTAPSAGVPGAIAAPPFAQKAAADAAPAAAAPAKAKSADPFAAADAATIAASKKITLVIDDSAVDQSEIGRETKKGAIVAFAMGSALGLILASAFMSTANERGQYNMAVRDGKAIYSKIQEVSKVLNEVKKHMKSAVVASQSTPSKVASVDYKAIEAVVAMERPFQANEFHRRRYLAFPTHVVDNLFDYYNNMNLLWDRFTMLGAKTTGSKKRKALDESAKAADGLIKVQYGIVTMKANEQIVTAIVYLEIPPPDPDNPPEPGAGPKLMVSSAPGGRQVERELYIGQEDFAENNGKYVFLVDKVRSGSVLGEPANLFSKYKRNLMEVNAILTKNSEIQGRLLKELGKVASLEERGLF